MEKKLKGNHPASEMSPDEQRGINLSMPEVDLDLIGKMFAQKMADSSKDARHLSSRKASQPATEEQSQQKVRDRYNPMAPNNYEQVLRERELLAEEEKEKQLQEEYLLRAQLYEQAGKNKGPEEKVAIMDDSNALIDRKIVRMLEKHGWEYGKGIGLMEDGIKNPLVAVKTTGTSAVIKPYEDAGLDTIIGLPQKRTAQSQQASQPAPPQSGTVVYQSAPVVDDPRIKPIQEKYFRT